MRAAGITHVVNLTRSARNCAEQAETSTGASAGELHSLRLPVLGNKGEPYRDLWQRLAAHASSVRADAGKLLVHGATDAIELRVFVMCAGVLAGAARGMSLTHALARVTDAQREALAGREGPVGLAMWHLKPLYEWLQTVDEGRLGGETMEGIKAQFEHPNTPQAQLACCDWRCGPTDAVLRIGGDDAEDYPLLYGRARTTVWFGGHQMVVESVSGDPRVAFIHNLVTAEEAQELIAAAQNVGLKQSLVGNMKERYMHAVPPSSEEVREEAARQGRTSTSCRVDRSLPVAAAVVLRVSFLLGMSPYCSEAVQVVHYEEGQEYQVLIRLIRSCVLCFAAMHCYLIIVGCFMLYAFSYISFAILSLSLRARGTVTQGTQFGKHAGTQRLVSSRRPVLPGPSAAARAAAGISLLLPL